MKVGDLYNWLVENRYNVLAANVNQAAGLMADALSDEGGDLYIAEYTPAGQPKEVPDQDDG